jgi:sugar phosphate isomerase/epimerase
MMELATSNYGCPAMPFEELLAHAKAIGFAAVELMTNEENILKIPYTTALSRLDAAALSEIREGYRRHRLGISSVGLFVDIATGDDSVDRPGMVGTKRCFEIAAYLADGGPVPPVVGIPRGKPHLWDDTKQLLAERTAELAADARAYGSRFLIKAHAGYAIDVPWKLVWLLGQVGSDGFAFDFDMSHFEAARLTIPQALPLLPNTAHVHLKSYGGPEGSMALPGEGTSDFVEQFRQFRRFGYDGYLTLEVSAVVQNRPSFNPVDAMRAAHEYLTTCLVEAGIRR